MFTKKRPLFELSGIEILIFDFRIVSRILQVGLMDLVFGAPHPKKVTLWDPFLKIDYTLQLKNKELTLHCGKSIFI